MQSDPDFDKLQSQLEMLYKQASNSPIQKKKNKLDKKEDQDKSEQTTNKNNFFF